jgi:hypothetical protein
LWKNPSSPNEPKTRLGTFLVAYIELGFNSHQGAIMAVHILGPIVKNHIPSQPPNTTDEELENNPARQKALAELKDIFDGYNKEINEYNELELKRFEEEAKREKEEQEQRSLVDKEYSRRVILMCNIYNTCYDIVKELQELRNAL